MRLTPCFMSFVVLVLGSAGSLALAWIMPVSIPFYIMAVLFAIAATKTVSIVRNIK